MARKLKTYQTSLGFFEQAIAAPSMKAALEAWGADRNPFPPGCGAGEHRPGRHRRGRSRDTRRAAALCAEIEAIQEKLNAEEADWGKEKQRLKVTLRRAAD
jgi:hypothetical protein